MILLLLLPGCASFKGYTGAERQPDEIAIIKARYWQAYWGFGFVTLRFTSLDGIAMGPVRYTSEIHMEPGEHNVAFRYVITYGCTDWGCADDRHHGSLSFTAQKGHRYKLDAEREDGELWAWIIDRASGEIIAGERPP